MEELNGALVALGINVFKPVFDGQLYDLGANCWYLGWEVRGSPEFPPHFEARFGVGTKQERWVPLESGQDEQLIKDARDHYTGITLKHMTALACQEMVVEPEVRGFSLEEIKLNPLEWHLTKGEKPKPQPPSQDRVAEALNEAYGGYLMREVEDVFVHVGTHWVEQQPKVFKRFIRSSAQKLMSGAAKDRELDAHYNMLLDKTEQVPHGMSFYQQNPCLANFLDGTLEIVRQGNAYTLNFREHRREDFLTWVLPYRFDDPRPKNSKFREWLNKAFTGDPDAEGKIRALKQIGGACLISLFPRTAFLYGPAGTGKSTFAKLCAAFVGKDNVSGVQPSQMQQGSFMMESLISKQVNIVTDISEARIDSAIFKQIEDRVRFQINRKNKLAIMSYIPALHIFGGNVLPRGIDGSSTAMDRRISIVEFIQDVGPGSGGQIRDYEQIILNAGAGDVLQFFVDGLLDLCESGGIYFNPESGKKKLAEWKLDNDPLGMFFEAIRSGDYPTIKLHRDASIRAGVLWNAFQEYRKDRKLWSSIGRNAFYEAVREQGLPSKEDNHKLLMFYGIGDFGLGGQSVNWSD